MIKKAEFLTGLKKLYQQSRTDPYDLFIEALAVGFEDDYEQSIEIIDKSLYLSTDLDNPEKLALFWTFKAMALNKLNRDHEALFCVEKSIEILKDDALNWNIKGDLLHDLGKYQEALEAYENSIKFSDEEERPEALLDKVEILNHLEKNEEALKAVNEALQWEPKNTNALDLKSDVLDDLGRTEEALQVAEKGFRRRSNSDFQPDAGYWPGTWRRLFLPANRGAEKATAGIGYWCGRFLYRQRQLRLWHRTSILLE